VKRAEHLIPVGLLAAAISATASAIALWQAGVSVSEWSAGPAVEHPVWLGIGDALGIVAAVTGSISLAALALRHSGSSVLATFVVIFLGFAVVGAVVITVLDFALIVTAQDDVLAAIEFRLRWVWWNALGWVLLGIGGLIAVLTIGIGAARRNPSLRYPALSLAASALLLALYPLAGVVLLALALIWVAAVLARSFPNMASSGSPRI
jgi:hypothetical protein